MVAREGWEGGMGGRDCGEVARGGGEGWVVRAWRWRVIGLRMDCARVEGRLPNRRELWVWLAALEGWREGGRRFQVPLGFVGSSGIRRIAWDSYDRLGFVGSPVIRRIAWDS